MVSQTPQKPGRDAFERYEQLADEMAALEPRIPGPTRARTTENPGG
ncbi:MAG: hypothetical protein GWM90_13275 [Gemmatimonadetes bacterium]|nr:hypothetical protein [Gemmatimonadota bacterium]NIQ55042.1 hypothetical protein [Gemmatimonadota bacterium]NIU75233.1 hypothetical protein [Gammaproteobacteria bacterium]NIX45046.1 hypothetical protein [Gemmatimonadota bacterium]NIY09279.1 hypothetical protein [Gemmatimonadota bacterium]